MKTVRLNFIKVKDKHDAHERIKKVFGLPDYYGYNLDALYDCLTEFCRDSVVVIRNIEDLRESLGDYADDIMQTFDDAHVKVILIENDPDRMKKIKNKNYPEERALYGANDLILYNCTFEGEEDGESALKEAHNIYLDGCTMKLRYPLWHDTDVYLNDTVMTDTCRAALWYTKAVDIDNCTLGGVKALRECSGVRILNSAVDSPEFGWRTKGIHAENTTFKGEYPFFGASDIRMKNIKLKGKYSFQYAENVLIEDSYLDTKDAFWHAKYVTVKNSLIKGEYLSWYSDHLTLINCKIVGTQPLCYCDNLKLINCETEGCDFSFEYSDVNAVINGDILSVKNPRHGAITADSIGEIILTGDSVYGCDCKITTKDGE